MKVSRRVVTVGCAVALVTLAGCDGSAERSSASSSGRSVVLDTTGPEWSSVAELAAGADASFVGHLVGEHSKEVDSGGNEDDAGGIPVAFYDFHVDDVLSGPKDLQGSTIVVEWLQSGVVTTDPPTSDIKDSDEVVIFAEHLTSEEAPGIETVADFYVPLGFDNGLMDLENATFVVPRNPIVSTLAPRGPKARGWELREIKQFLVDRGN